MLNGYKTYIAGGFMMLQAAIGIFFYFSDSTFVLALDPVAALSLFANGLGFIGVRFALASKTTAK